MKSIKTIFTIINISLLGGFYHHIHAQVLNDDKVHITAVLEAGYGRISPESAGGGSNPKFIGKIVADEDNAATLVLNTAYSDDHNVDLNTDIACFKNPPTLVDEWGPIQNSQMGFIQGSTTGRFDYSVMSWESDWSGGGSGCQLINCGSDNCTDDAPAWDFDIIDVSDYPHTYNKPVESALLSNGSKYRWLFAWRFENGNSFFDPLDFGEIPSGQKMHRNATYAAPIGGDSRVQYTNTVNSTWYDDQDAGSFAQSSNDVVYTFEITGDMKRVTISTDHSDTDFDTYIHLSWWPANEENLRRIYSNDDVSPGSNTKSQIIKDLCPGRYAVVVEGYESATGKFKLTLDVADSPSDALFEGTISAVNDQRCEGEAIGTILSFDNGFQVMGDEGSPSNEPTEYLWQKKIGSGNFNTINNESDSALVNTGDMGTADVIFRRSLSLCGLNSGWAYDTVKYNAGAADGGMIELLGSSSIPEGFDPGELLTATGGSASSDPAPPKYQWQMSINNGISWPPIPGATGETYDIGNVPQTTLFRREVSNACESATDYSNEVEVTVIPANGEIRGQVAAPPVNNQDGVGIAGAEVCAIPLDTATIDYLMTKCDTTDENGNYIIDKVYYGGQTSRFLIGASFEDHDIRTTNAPNSDTTFEGTFTTNTTDIGPFNFVDRTVFIITGNIYQVFTNNKSVTNNWGKSNVTIFLNGEPETITDNMGNFGMTAPSAGTYVIKPQLMDSVTGHQHRFVPDSMVIQITKDTTGLLFEDTTTFSLNGYLGVSCNKPLGGDVEVLFKQDPAVGTFSETFNIGEEFNLILPARDYLVSVVETDYNGLDISKYDLARVKNQLDKVVNVPVNLLHSDTSLFVYYQPAPVVELIGIPDAIQDCSDYIKVSLLKQGEVYPDFKIKAWTGPISNNCPLDSGTVVITAGGFQVNKEVRFGDVEYELVGGQPIEQSPHTATVTVAVNDFPRSNDGDTKSFDILVVGDKPVGERFVKTSPSIPFLVLHDPPGDMSYSFLMQDSTYETSVRTAYKRSSETGSWEYTQYGSAYSLGLSAGPVSESIDIKAVKTDDETVSATNNDSRIRETIFGTKISSTYRTSAEEDATLIGAEGDVFVSHTINFLFSETRKIRFEECSVNISTGLAFQPDSIQSTTVSTARGIRNEIDKLIDIRDANPNTDSVWIWDSQIKIWENMLKENEEWKEKVHAQRAASPYYVETKSFNGGTAEDFSITKSTTNFNSVEFLLELDTSETQGFDGEIAGNGTSNSTLTRVRVETGRSRFNNTIKETTTGYTLEDNDSDDDFQVFIYEDPRYGTPIFISEGSTTSCPYEEGSLPLDNFELLYDAKYEDSYGDAPSNPGVTFGFEIQNNGTEDRTFLMNNDLAYSKGAIVDIAGEGGQDIKSGIIVAGGKKSFEVVVRRNEGIGSVIFGFPKIRINVAPECFGLFYPTVLSKSIDFSVNFSSTCSTIDLVDPIPNQRINIASNNILPIQMQNYDKTKISTVVLEYSEQGSGSWTPSGSMSFDVADLPDGGAGYRVNWTVSEIQEDGQYELRLKVICPIGTIRFSNIVPIVIDRKKPEVLGIPNPIDDVFDLNENDVISVSFDEEIRNNAITAMIVDIINGDTLAATVGAFGNTVEVSPTLNLQARPPSIYRAIVSFVQDVNDNVADTYRWVFIVGDYSFEEASCLPNLEITNNNENQDAISVSAYRALSITSDGQIPKFGTTTYTAQDDINLNAGFEVGTSGVFIGQIENCVDE